MWAWGQLTLCDSQCISGSSGCYSSADTWRPPPGLLTSLRSAPHNYRQGNINLYISGWYGWESVWIFIIDHLLINLVQLMIEGKRFHIIFFLVQSHHGGGVILTTIHHPTLKVCLHHLTQYLYTLCVYSMYNELTLEISSYKQHLHSYFATKALVFANETNQCLTIKNQ